MAHGTVSEISLVNLREMDCSNRSGLGLIGTTIVVGVLVVLFGGGPYVLNVLQTSFLVGNSTPTNPLNQARQVVDQLTQKGSEGQKQVEQLGSSSIINTSIWKTYRNGQYGFEFQYPEEFYIVSAEPADIPEALFKFSIAMDDTMNKNSERMRVRTLITVYEELPPESVIGQLGDEMTGQKAEITRWEKISDDPLLYKMHVKNSDHYYGLAIRKGTYISISNGSGPTADQILSTFKFTK